MARYCKNGHKVDDQMNFCPQCGAEVTDKEFCKKCGHERVGDEQFCSNCGTPYKTEGLSVINNKVLGRSGAFCKKIPRSLIIGLLALFIVGGGLFYWFFIRTDYSFEGLAKTLAENDFRDVGVFSDGLAMVDQDAKIGYMDKNGKMVIPCIYEIEEGGGHSHTSEGLTKVLKDGKYGFVDMAGIEVIPCKYDYAEDFSEGLSAVCQDENWSFIDKKGNVAIDLSTSHYAWIYGFSEGLAAVSITDDQYNSQWGYIDKEGKEVISLEYEQAYPFRDGLAAVRINEKWGFIDKTNKLVIPCKYGEAHYFSEGLAVVQDEDYKCGVIDKTGKEVLPIGKYNWIDDFSEGLAKIQMDMKYGFIDKTGKIVIPCIYDTDEICDDDYVCRFSDGLASVYKDGQYGIINKKGEVVVPFGKYGLISSFSEGLAAVCKDGIWGFINTKGESTFDHISESQLTAMKERQEKKREEEQRKWEEENDPRHLFYRLAQRGDLVWSFDFYEDLPLWTYGRYHTFFIYPASLTSGYLSYIEYKWEYERGNINNGKVEKHKVNADRYAYRACTAYYTITEGNLLTASLLEWHNASTDYLRAGQTIILQLIKNGEQIVLKEMDGIQKFEYKQRPVKWPDHTRGK